MSATPGPRWRLNMTLAQVEVILLALGLTVTVTLSTCTLLQTTKHFCIERTSAFVTRFNSQELVDIREDVDRWLGGKETATALYQRSSQGETVEAIDAKQVIVKLRTITNFFQEFGTALKHGSLDDQYAADLLGAVCVRYGVQLEGFINETRVQRKRALAYEEVLHLKQKMLSIDQSFGDGVEAGK